MTTAARTTEWDGARRKSANKGLSRTATDHSSHQLMTHKQILTNCHHTAHHDDDEKDDDGSGAAADDIDVDGYKNHINPGTTASWSKTCCLYL